MHEYERSGETGKCDCDELHDWMLQDPAEDKRRGESHLSSLSENSKLDSDPLRDPVLQFLSLIRKQ